MPKFAKYDTDAISGNELIVLKDVTATKTRTSDTGSLVRGGIGVPLTHILTDTTGANAILTDEDVNYVYNIENGANNVEYNIEACFVDANEGAAIRFYKEGSGSLRIEPGAFVIGSSLGGTGHIENTTSETGAMIEIQIKKVAGVLVGRIVSDKGSWDLE